MCLEFIGIEGGINYWLIWLTHVHRRTRIFLFLSVLFSGWHSSLGPIQWESSEMVDGLGGDGRLLVYLSCPILAPFQSDHKHLWP